MIKTNQMIKKIYTLLIEFFPEHLTKDQVKDSGMAFALIFLLLGYVSKQVVFFKIALPVLLLNMIWPFVYLPFAKIWFGLSKLIGSIVSKIILFMTFYIIVTPVGVFRRILGYDSLHLKEWKNGSTSVFMVRNHIFKKEDIENPF